MLQEQAAETESRTAGVDKLQKFLDRVLPELGLSDSSIFFEELCTMSASELLEILERINGVLTEIPINNRDSLTSESGVQNEFMFNSATELVPPPVAIRKRLLDETISVLKQQLNNNLPDYFEPPENPENTQQVVARTLFNTIIYLHPFDDGNGRTARAVYYSLSPNITDKSTTELATRLSERPKSLKKYHQVLNQSTLEMMLNVHGIEWSFTETPYLPMFDTDNPTRGLDADNLRFIAAFDVMSDEEKNQYIGKKENNLEIKQESLPPELISKIDKRMDAIREEFTDYILDFSVYPEKWPDWLQEPLSQAFSQTDIVGK